MMARSSANSRAQAMVEFAIVAPIFFLLVFAIIDFGRYVYYVQIINNAAREGARYAIVHGDNGIPSTGPPDDATGSEVKKTVRDYLIGVVDAGALTITPTWPQGNNLRGSLVTVQIDYQFRSVIPLVPLPAVTVRGESTLVINS